MRLPKSIMAVIVCLLVLALSSPAVYAKPNEEKGGKVTIDTKQLAKWLDKDDDDDRESANGARSEQALSGLLAQIFGALKFRFAYGTVTEVNTSKGQPSITIKNLDNKLETFTSGNGVTVWRNGKQARLSDLKVGDRAALFLNPSGHVLTIIASAAGQTTPTPPPATTQTGNVVRVINESTIRALTIELNSGTNTYLLTTNAKVSFKNWSAGTFADIREGDRVTFKLDNSKISELTVETVTNSDAGQITAISTSAISIKRGDGTTKAYPFGQNMNLAIQGISAPKLSDVRVGDMADLLLRDGIVRSLHVIPANLINGTIQNLIKTSDYRGVIIQTANNSLVTYEFATNGKVSFKDQTGANFDDIRVGDLVTVRLVDGKIIDLVIDSVATSDRGTVTAISTTSVTIRRDNDTTQSYRLGQNMALTITGISQPKLSDVIVGDKVELGLRDSIVFAMQVTPAMSVNGTIETIVNTTAARALTIRKANGEIVTYPLATNAIVVVKDQPNATFANLLSGDTVAARMVDNKIVRLEAEYAYTTVEGTVTLTDLAGTPKKVYLLLSNGNASQAYTLANPCTVTIPGIANPTLSQIKVGDRAALRVRGDLVSSIAINPQLTIFNAVFVRVTGSSSKPGIEVIRDAQVTNYTLASSYTVVVPNKSNPTLSDIAAGKTVKITMEADLVRKIEVVQ